MGPPLADDLSQSLHAHGLVMSLNVSQLPCESGHNSHFDGVVANDSLSMLPLRLAST